ncbi:MAG: 50S ribosomal protein L4 [Dermabacter sp.]|nr:50S ribosomal protein L4 [Dermabacter sp.]
MADHLTVDVLDTAGKKSGSTELPASIFDVQTNVALIHQVVVAQQAAARQGTHKTKTRGEVRGGGRKPYKQKGTGRARQGSIRAPQFTGGGVVHGPVPRDYSQRVPRKMKAAALRGALSDRARCGRIHVFSALIDGTSPSTKAVATTLKTVSERPHLLVVVRRTEDVAALSSRNLANAHVLFADQLNTYDVMLSDDVVFTAGALEDFIVQATAAAMKAPKKVAAPAAAADEAVSAPYGEGSAASLSNGSAPAGFTIKGNEGSKKYHTEDSPWYGRTKAEVWFATEDAAQAAGFVNAVRTADEEEAK